ncbi:hypothetical protein LINGRAHAP2_LOCUS32130, partial [Linum grandiflorum]
VEYAYQLFNHLDLLSFFVLTILLDEHCSLTRRGPCIPSKGRRNPADYAKF